MGPKHDGFSAESYNIFPMPDTSDDVLFAAIRRGDEAAFERLYDRYAERVRIAGWKTSHRADWVEEIVHEAWCRAFRMRDTFDGRYPFMVWMAGIVQNVYREHCRQSPLTVADPTAEQGRAAKVDPVSPEKVASAAEILAALNDCLSRLDAADQRLIRLRFFDSLPLRSVAQELKTPESTIREHRLPAALKRLQDCLAKKGIRISEVFSAQGADDLQYGDEVPS